MIRLSVTDLDQYLYWRTAEDMELDALIARLRHEEPPTPAMLAGRAFHTLLEETTSGELHKTTVDGIEFVFYLDQELALPPIRELKAEAQFDTPSGPVTFVGKVDALNGTAVHDYKLTERFEAERYADSYQWRAYLTMFEARQFIYDAFQCRFDSDTKVIVYDYHRFAMYAYPEMRADVQRAVCGLAEIVAKYVPEKIAA